MMGAELIAAAQVAAPGDCPVAGLATATLEETQAAWLARFNALDLPCFLRFFAADATVFTPIAVDNDSRRVDPPDIEEYWTGIFARLGQGRRTLSITPRDLTVTHLGTESAVVTFHLSDDANPSRRTLVWRHEEAGWRIVHLHGSRLDPEPTPPPR